MVRTRALISCCAVALAQRLGQNSRVAQQPPRDWLRRVQHVIMGAQKFSLHAISFCVIFIGRSFVLGGGHLFFEFAVGKKKKRANFPIRRGRQKENGPSCFSP